MDFKPRDDEPRTKNPPSPAQAASRSAETRRVLVVDDEAMVLSVVCRMLQRAGYKVSSASNAAQALDVFASDPQGFSLLMTDIVMPGMDGVTLAARIRAQAPDLPILLMSAWSTYASASTSLEHPLLSKPFSRSELFGALRLMLDDVTEG